MSALERNPPPGPDAARVGAYDLLVVCDANMYIGIGHAELSAAAARETAVGVLTVTSVWPCLELLARCVSLNPRTRQRAWSALRKLALHAGYLTRDCPRLRLHEAGEFSLTRGIFGVSPHDPLLEVASVADLVNAAATKSLDDLLQDHSAALEAIAERVRSEEERFRASLSNGLTQVGRPRLSAGAPTTLHLQLIAAGLVQVLAEQHGIPLTPENSRRGIAVLVSTFALPLCFVYRMLVDASAAAGLPGGGNSVWDLKLSFHGYGGSSVAGLPVLLVTDDGRLHNAARDAGTPQRVIRRDDYLSLLTDRTAVKRRAADLNE